MRRPASRAAGPASAERTGAFTRRRARESASHPSHPPCQDRHRRSDSNRARLALALGANGATGSEPYYEISATGGKYDRGTGVSIELDTALPIRGTGEDGTALFLQPGAVLLDGPGGRRLYGASLGVVYRLPTAGGVAGVNAFYDRNRAGDSLALAFLVAAQPPEATCLAP